MGACFSCCGDDEKKSAPGGYSNFSGAAGGGGGGTRVDTEKDREARVLAAERAAARQEKFETSAVGKAAYKSVKEVQDSRKTGGVGNTGQPTAADWQN
ncbi:hypothetical protein HYH03_000795 [Edaphochlamys debaryana]|uniref:Uncharacterized protein n=1 Tax=Edaphochlamys debaryana TaxID=47281 RepID=A0A835YE11_9CHLO|nr:hypothetical protein HYH03_000795 [Edaphochlamys debaryana]|eukprot:KAG2500973.1 hypothetical protein HYH03_000795 [Edaphochlamys debaryana]